jgi:hypothetical protein
MHDTGARSDELHSRRGIYEQGGPSLTRSGVSQITPRDAEASSVELNEVGALEPGKRRGEHEIRLHMTEGPRNLDWRWSVERL